jgi:transposase
MSSGSRVRAAVARSKQRGRVAIVIADNLKTHTSAGSLLVRSMLTELREHLRLVYTPAYDPDANRHSMALARLATGGHA